MTKLELLKNLYKQGHQALLDVERLEALTKVNPSWNGDLIKARNLFAEVAQSTGEVLLSLCIIDLKKLNHE